MVFSLKAKANITTSAGLTFTSQGIGLAIIDQQFYTPRLLHTRVYPSNDSNLSSILAKLSQKNNLDTIPCNFVLNPDENQFLQV